MDGITYLSLTHYRADFGVRTPPLTTAFNRFCVQEGLMPTLAFELIKPVPRRTGIFIRTEAAALRQQTWGTLRPHVPFVNHRANNEIYMKIYGLAPIAVLPALSAKTMTPLFAYWVTEVLSNNAAGEQTILGCIWGTQTILPDRRKVKTVLRSSMYRAMELSTPRGGPVPLVLLRNCARAGVLWCDTTMHTFEERQEWNRTHGWCPERHIE